MTPFDLPRLNWGDHLGDAPVAAAHRDLMGLTTRAVTLHSLSLIPHVPQSCYCAWSEGIHIFIEASSDRIQHCLVHELLHGILVEEGYCRIAARLTQTVRGMFSNEMQHPEIFRRMEAYELDMSPYWIHWDGELSRHLEYMLHKLTLDDYAGYSQMIQLFTWFYFQSVSARYLAEYSRRGPASHRAAQDAYEATRGIGFGNAMSQRRSFEVLQDHWARFCAEHLPAPFGEEHADYIRDGSVQPLMDIERVRPAEEIMTLFRKEGLRL